MYKSRIILRFKPLASRRILTKARAALGLSPRRRGGQPGNGNRLIHGRYSRHFLARRAHIQGILRQARVLIAEMNQTARRIRADYRMPSALRRFDNTHGSSATLAATIRGRAP